MDRLRSLSLQVTDVDKVEDIFTFTTTVMLEVIVRTMLQATMLTAVMPFMNLILTVGTILTQTASETITKRDTQRLLRQLQQVLLIQL